MHMSSSHCDSADDAGDQKTDQMKSNIKKTQNQQSNSNLTY